MLCLHRWRPLQGRFFALAVHRVTTTSTRSERSRIWRAIRFPSPWPPTVAWSELNAMTHAPDVWVTTSTRFGVLIIVSNSLFFLFLWSSDYCQQFSAILEFWLLSVIFVLFVLFNWGIDLSAIFLLFFFFNWSFFTRMLNFKTPDRADVVTHIPINMVNSHMHSLNTVCKLRKTKKWEKIPNRG